MKENEELANTLDPYLMEPKNRNPGFVVNTTKPFNAETPLEILSTHFYTPNEWYIMLFSRFFFIQEISLVF